MRMYNVRCLDTGVDYLFSGNSAEEVMQKLKYTLDLAGKDDAAVVYKTKSGLHLVMEHRNKVYGVRI